VNVPTWVIGLVCGLIGALLGLAVKWGVQQALIAHLQLEVVSLKSKVDQLTARIENLALMIAEQRGLERGRETTGRHATQLAPIGQQKHD